MLSQIIVKIIEHNSNRMNRMESLKISRFEPIISCLIGILQIDNKIK